MPYHYILTLLQGTTTAHLEGVIDLPPNSRRSEVLAKIREANQIPRSMGVTFFSLEPDELA